MEIRQVIIVDASKDPRVILDNERSEWIPETLRCERCEGTGNELLFMYRRCQACGGDGYSREVKAV